MIDCDQGDGAVRRTYDPGRANASLSDVVPRAIEAFDEEALGRGQDRLYDRVDLEALDGLFQRSTDPSITVQFAVDGVAVSLWGGDPVQVRVSARTH